MSSPVLAQDEGEEEAAEEEGGGDIDSLMAADPEREAGGEGEEGEAAEDEGGGDEEPPADAADDDERPPGEIEEESDEGEQEAPIDPDADVKKLSANLLAGYGLSLEDGPNPWGAGFGLQGAYDFGPVALGLRFVYYLGDTGEETTFSAFTGTTETRDITVNLFELTVEFGLDIQLSEPVLLRPEIGLGFASAARGDNSNLYFAFSPGAALLYSFDSAFVGLDARFQLVAADPESVKALVFLAAIGMRF